MSKFKIGSIIFILLVSSATVEAQGSPGAQVQLSCDSSELIFEVYPGANTTGEMICTVTNPTSYTEKIELNESHGDAGVMLQFVGGNVIDVPPDSEENVTVIVTAFEEVVSASHSLEITAEVLEANGIQPSSVATDSVNLLLTFNAYDNYSGFSNNPIVFTIFDQITASGESNSAEEYGEVSLANNGNYNSMLKAITADLANDLQAHNLSLGIPTVTMNIPVNDSAKLQFQIGSVSSSSGVNTSSWLVLNNGSKLLTLNSSMYFESVEASAGNSYCYQCNQSISLILEIYLVPEDSNQTNGNASNENGNASNENGNASNEENESVPGFQLILGVLSIVCAAMALNRNTKIEY